MLGGRMHSLQQIIIRMSQRKCYSYVLFSNHSVTDAQLTQRRLINASQTIAILPIMLCTQFCFSWTCVHIAPFSECPRLFKIVFNEEECMASHSSILRKSEAPSVSACFKYFSISEKRWLHHCRNWRSFILAKAFRRRLSKQRLNIIMFELKVAIVSRCVCVYVYLQTVYVRHM